MTKIDFVLLYLVYNNIYRGLMFRIFETLQTNVRYNF